MKPFYKALGLGNDFVLFDGRNDAETDWNALTVRVCDRRTGIGADGSLILINSDVADVRMRIINADGSEAALCGNGICAFSRFVFENGIVHGTEFSVETCSGIMKPRVILKEGRVEGVRVDMGMPLLDAKDIPVNAQPRALNQQLTIEGRTFTYSAVRVGVPHTIVFVDTVKGEDVLHYGQLIERDPLFPERTNVDFIEILAIDRIKMRTWERGADRMLACGTGACSAVVAAVLAGKVDRKAAVEVDLGTLYIEWSATDNHVYMTCPAEIVFSGIWND